MSTTRPLRAVPDHPAVPLAEAIDAYLATLDHPESAGTRRTYGSRLAMAVRHLGPGTDVAAVTGQDLAATLKACWGTRKPATWNLARTVIRSAWAYFGEQGWTGPAVAQALQRRKPRARKNPPVPRRVLDDLLGDYEIPVRERCLWRMLYETGARVSEVLRLNVEDLDIPRRSAEVIRKGGKPALVIWDSGTALLLPRMLGKRTAGPLFVTSDRADPDAALADIDPDGLHGRLSYRQAAEVFQRHTEEYPGGPFRLHQIRHLVGHEAADRGESAFMIQKRLGHGNVRTSAIYVGGVSDEAYRKYRAANDPARRK